MREERNKFWVDRFQTLLFIRICVYLGIFVFCLGNLLYILRLLEEGPGNPFVQYFSALSDAAPVLVCILLLVPIMAYDSLRFTHRLVGPLARFRHAIQAVTRGEAIRPIKLREGDYLDEMRDDFNRLLEALQKQGLPVLKPLEGVKANVERKLG